MLRCTDLLGVLPSVKQVEENQCFVTREPDGHLVLWHVGIMPNERTDMPR